ncbi:MAG: hypothetical protein ACI9MR_005261 [Myxococcota bacterium]|jgi:hypothetical protein
MSEPATQTAVPDAASETHFRLQLAGPMRYDVWLSAESLRLKQGVRRGVIPLADVTHYGLKRIEGDRASLTELRLVTPGKVHKVPFHTGDAQAHALLAALQAHLPEGDLSGKTWGEAAPLLGLKPFGIRDYFAQPMAAAGLMMLILAAAATMLHNDIFPTWCPPQTRSIAWTVLVGAGVVLMGLAWGKRTTRRKREEHTKGTKSTS